VEIRDEIPLTDSDEIARNIEKGQVVVIPRPGIPDPEQMAEEMEAGGSMKAFVARWFEFGCIVGWGPDWVKVRICEMRNNRPFITNEYRRIGYNDIGGIMG
jgi:hypothetical protein